LIIQQGALVDIRDNKKHAVWYYAKKNKATRPHIYKVIMAGRAVQNWVPGIEPQDGKIFTLDELLIVREDSRKCEIIERNLKKYTEGLMTLKSYATVE
jgi:hypothetical protein